jgi:hypothetical protein
VTTRLIVNMAVMLLLSLGLPAVFGRVLVRRDAEARTAAWLSAVAVLPGAVLLGEMAARNLKLASELEPHRYVTLWPSLLGAGGGFLFIVASLVVEVPLRGPKLLDAIRLIHLVTWGYYTFVALWALISG